MDFNAQLFPGLGNFVCSTNITFLFLIYYRLLASESDRKFNSLFAPKCDRPSASAQPVSVSLRPGDLSEPSGPSLDLEGVPSLRSLLQLNLKTISV